MARGRGGRKLLSVTGLWAKGKTRSPRLLTCLEQDRACCDQPIRKGRLSSEIKQCRGHESNFSRRTTSSVLTWVQLASWRRASPFVRFLLSG